jgi:Xaa-Pro aminopeptidase
MTIPPLSAHLQNLIDADYPGFSDSEMARRRAAVSTLLTEQGCDHLLFCGANRSGSVVQWLTQWPVTAEAVGIFTPGERDALFVQHVNHEPLARIIARDADALWGGASSVRAALDVLEKRGARNGRVAFMGPLSLDQHAALTERFGTPKNLNRAYVTLRQVKSAEELDWLRIGAYFSDLGMAALHEHARPGVNERELGSFIEQSYSSLGGTHFIHYIGATSMLSPAVGVPRQYASARKIEVGDVVTAEITAAFWEQQGQVLRSCAIGMDPPPLYRELHAVADAAFDAVTAILKAGTTPAQVIEAAGVIEDAGFTIIDDLLHGYGGGYLPPILGSKSRPAGPVPEAPFRAGQTVVVQPNVVTRDRTAGVQTGEMLLITETGVERMHAFPRGFGRVG